MVVPGTILTNRSLVYFVALKTRIVWLGEPNHHSYSHITVYFFLAFFFFFLVSASSSSFICILFFSNSVCQDLISQLVTGPRIMRASAPPPFLFPLLCLLNPSSLPIYLPYPPLTPPVRPLTPYPSLTDIPPPHRLPFPPLTPYLSSTPTHPPETPHAPTPLPTRAGHARSTRR